MANVNNPNGYRAIRDAHGGPLPLVWRYTTSNLTLNPGDAVVMATNGTLSLATVSSTAIWGVCQSKVTAIAATRQKVAVIPALEDIIFSGQTTTWESSSKMQNGASCDIGGATGVMILTSTTTNAVARIIGLSKEIGNVDGNYARLEFVFQKSQYTGQA